MSAERFDAANLKHEVEARMEDLGLTNEMVARRGGPSTTKVSQIRKGDPKPPRGDVLRKLDKGLRWVDGSARRVTLGGKPVPLPDGLDLHEVLAEIQQSGLSDHARKTILRALQVDDDDQTERGAL